MRVRRALTGLVVAGLVALTAPAAATQAMAKPHARADHHGLIVFNADQTGSYQLYTIRPDGSGLRQITHLAAGDAQSPDFSPDGRRIAFDLSLPDATSGDDPDSIKIGVVDSDGSHLRWIPLDGQRVNQPSFTADGQGIVYERFDGINQDSLWTARLDGSHQRRLTWPGPGQWDTEPNVAPDGRTVSFVRHGANPDETEAALFTLNLRTGRQRQLTPFAFNVASKTGWSPTGRRIVFSRDAYHLTPGVSGNVNTISRTGHRLREVTHFRGGDITAYAGSYSPDGRHVVYRREATDDYSLVVARSDGTHPRTILHSATLRPRGSDWGPACSG
jgi:Tol biopolymer transport system component